jgi:hypothetical protein
LLLVAAGCGHGSKDAELVPVYGKVLFHGRPLAGGTVVFVPDPERGGRGPLAIGTIGGDGKYMMRSEGKLGVVPGWHRITVSGPAQPGDESLPCCYTDPEHSGLAREVLAGKANVFDLPLE